LTNPKKIEEEKTADQAIRDDRCAIPIEVYQDVAVLASAAKKTNCEVQVDAIKYYIDKTKLRSACSSGELRDPQACKCAEV